jgi:hypothetical protein
MANGRRPHRPAIARGRTLAERCGVPGSEKLLEEGDPSLLE